MHAASSALQTAGPFTHFLFFGNGKMHYFLKMRQL